ncbi:hypothetical protein [Dubosiella newyorkensis]|uniref:hypothetical protein n=1 Tax=Dubosiella newyorkensis TaxID=1862672 RepID=UPI00272ED12F|nr:hypothetical protein [Dubosiella newyorkensis]
MNEKSILRGSTSEKLTLEGSLSIDQTLHCGIELPDQLSGQVANDPHLATNDYDLLINQPKINGITLSGNKLSRDLGIDDMNFATMADIDSIFLEEEG